MNLKFSGFPKIPRFSRDIVITEKIDGTNAQVVITEDGNVLAGSRSQYITPLADNHGFATWVEKNKEELRKLGVGQHFGEWWGSGVNRGYGLVKGEKRFSLFNTKRWASIMDRPLCCSIVPVLYKGDFNSLAIATTMLKLQHEGSKASPGFMNPEGIVIYHTAGNIMFKKTFEQDNEHKGNS